MPVPVLGGRIQQICDQMECFEASESVPRTGTGARREGQGFERLVAQLWHAVREAAADSGAQASVVAGRHGRRYTRLSVDGRSLLVPALRLDEAADGNCAEARWLETVFPVGDLITCYPTVREAIRRYAPSSGRYQGENYPTIYRGLTTRFDDTVLLVDGGVLREKIMLEYKTAKSSGGEKIDGNAHERLSFQIMQYLEVATRYPRCSLVVIANGAFVRYRNKYHVNFHVQADRLSNFAWFSMEYLSTSPEYRRFLQGLLDWLFAGRART